MRKKVVAGNWKMNLTTSESVSFINNIKDACSVEDTTVIFFVPSVNIIPAKENVKGTHINIGCQNIHQADKGAYTGEISADMLLDLGIKYTLVGHSERREYFNETDEVVNAKVLQSIKKGLTPVLCCGENLDQRESGVTATFVKGQIVSALKGVSKEDMQNVIIAYEPIWAIGTGKTATSQEAQDTCKVVRETLVELYDAATAEATSILYGGSVSVDNAAELFAMADIDGGLVGGASLKPDFSKIILA